METRMPDPIDDQIELTPTEARQGRRGTHVFVILGVSTLLAIGALAAFWMQTAQQ
jgi:hypothetical protein